MFNLPANVQYAKSNASATSLPTRLFTSLLTPGSGIHQFFLKHAFSTDATAMARDAKAVSMWNFDRIIPCHGDIVASGGKQLWLKAFAVYL